MNITHIVGGSRLIGDIWVSGAKNACLPMLAATLLTSDACVLRNVPILRDIQTMLEIFRNVHADVTWLNHHTLKIGTSQSDNRFPFEYVSQIRGSVCLMGACIGRYGHATVPKPGGCRIGERPIDLHIKGFQALGYDVKEEKDLIFISAGKLHGATIHLCGPFGSTMTGTMNVIMAALPIPETTIIKCAAKEPEVIDFCNCLRSMGADISGDGTSEITIHGGRTLHGYDHTVIGDRIEAGTFACAALATQGKIRIFGLKNGLLSNFITTLSLGGASIFHDFDHIIHVESNGPLSPLDVITGPHPGFPTDLQAQVCALLTQSDGTSTVEDKVFPRRFLYVNELQKMGARIQVSEGKATIHAPTSLTGAMLQATDLRASAALYIAGLCAKGETCVYDTHHLERGYENFCEKLRALGANIFQSNTNKA